MITSIEIENLRGIKKGRLEGLGKLTILTGPNACGKSTVLDALLIGCSPDPADAVGRAVSRHPALSAGARWLIQGGQRKARIKVGADIPEGWARLLECLPHCTDEMETSLALRKSSPPYSMVSIEEDSRGFDTVADWTGFGADNQYEKERDGGAGASSVRFVRLVDPGAAIPLHRTFTAVSQAGRRESVNELLSQLIAGFERLEILALTEVDFGLAVTSNGRSVPLGLSGDGIQAFVQLALEIAVAPEGLVLVEEPEVYQHPRAIRQTARALLANMRRGVQMVITTHSLELIDALLAEAEGDDIEGLVLFNLLLENGELKSGRRAGEEIAFARETLEKDLR